MYRVPGRRGFAETKPQPRVEHSVQTVLPPWLPPVVEQHRREPPVIAVHTAPHLVLRQVAEKVERR
eukprot:4834821-Pleurochrysis_carterae.AAC.1